MSADGRERVDVGAGVYALSAQLLGGDVVDRAEEDAGAVIPVSELVRLVRPKSDR